MRTFALAAAAWLGWTGAAAAAPQVLALVSTDAPIELTCAGGDCAARFTSYCLQPDRAAPGGGQRYTLAAAGAVDVVGVDGAGRTVGLDPAAVTIKAATSHVSVRLSVARAEVERLGLTSVAVRVRDDATLIPVPSPGDERPQTAADIELATTVLRELGRKLVDEDAVRMAAARETMYLVNRLSGGRLNSAQAQTAIGGILTPERLAALPAAARPFVTDARDYCALVADNDVSTTVRQCLEAEHDTMMFYLNQDYWDGLKGGS
jgi:hypothetical protein